MRLRNLEDQSHWKEFFDTYWKIIYNFARRAGLGDADAQDVVQETVIYVARKMPTFHYDPAVISFKNWMMQIARFRIIDHVRKGEYQNHGRKIARAEPLSTSLLEGRPELTAFELQSVWDEEWREHVVQAATERVKRRVSPGQYQMFHLHVMKKQPAKAVAQRLGVKLSEVYFARYKVSALVKKEIKLLEHKNI